MLELKPGARVRSVVSEAELVVVRFPGDPVDLRSGGHPMVPRSTEAVELRAVNGDFAGDLMIGKRYSSADGLVEVMVTKAGAGMLSVGDEPLVLKDAKKLPASD